MIQKTYCVYLFIITHFISSYGEGISKVSERPRNVEVEQIGTNGTSLYVTWEPPEMDIMSLSSCPLRGYIVRIKSSRDGQQQKWNVDANRRSLTLHEVREATTYHVRVSTMRCRGSSKSSRWVTIQTRRHQKRGTTATNSVSGPETTPPGKPQFVSTVAFADYVILTWEPPIEQVTVRGYMIGYGEGVPDVNWQYVDKDNRNVTIRNLKSSTQYVLSVRAFNNYGKGNVVYDLVYTKDKIESGSYTVTNSLSPPSNVRAKVLSPTTVWLQWTDTSLGRQQQISDNRYYNVHYQAIPQGKTLSVIVKALHVVLYDLSSGTDYAFKVRIVHDAQSSAFSTTVHNKTFSAAPNSPPRSLEVYQTADSSAVSIKWKPPKSSNEVTGYLVMYTSEPEETSTWQVLAVGGTLTETLVTNLQAPLTYHFKVQARNAVGYGPFSDVVVYTVQQDTWLSSGSINVTAKDGALDQRLSENPMVVTQALARSVEHDRDGSLLSNASLLSVPQAEQQISVQPSLDVTALVHHTVSAVISWRPACDARGADTYVLSPSLTTNVKYELRYHDTQHPSDITTQVISSTIAFIDGLRPNKLYKYHIIVHNSFQASWSVEGLLNT